MGCNNFLEIYILPYEHVLIDSTKKENFPRSQWYDYDIPTMLLQWYWFILLFIICFCCCWHFMKKFFFKKNYSASFHSSERKRKNTKKNAYYSVLSFHHCRSSVSHLYISPRAGASHVLFCLYRVQCWTPKGLWSSFEQAGTKLSQASSIQK